MHEWLISTLTQDLQIHATQMEPMEHEWKMGWEMDLECKEDETTEIVMVDLAFWDDSFEQDRSWDDFAATISSI